MATAVWIRSNSVARPCCSRCPRSGEKDFQVIAPQAIAAVRGIKWAVDSGEGKTSIFVVNGRVNVARSAGRRAVRMVASRSIARSIRARRPHSKDSQG